MPATLPYEVAPTYGETEPRDNIPLITILGSLLPERIPPTPSQMYGKSPLQRFAGTGDWQHTEPGCPLVKEALGLLVTASGGIVYASTDGEIHFRDTDWLTTDAASFEYYQPSNISAPLTIQPLQTLPLQKRLSDLYSLPEDQRLPDSDWPTDQAFEDAWKFVTLLPMFMSKLPYISVANDGEVNFGWDNDAMQIDLGFYGDSTYSYFARSNDGSEWIGDDIPVAHPLPDALFALLSD